MSAEQGGITPEQARAFYDRYGEHQDSHRHEDVALEKPKGSYDRFVATHVFDLLPFDQIEEGLTEVARGR